MSRWAEFPHDNSNYDYSADELAQHWPALHRGDCEPWPDKARVEALIENHPQALPQSFDGDCDGLVSQLQQGWCAFHAGDFQQAVERGEACGILGHALTNKAAGIYANHLETDTDRARSLYQQAIERAELAQQLLPDDPNAYYFHAFALGRMSQSISIVKALKQGLGGKIRDSLEQTLEMQPDHAEAHTAMGLYHAEIIDKVGKLIGGMTYGADKDEALAHFDQALKLTPDSPIAHIEYGNGLYLLYGDKRLDEVTECYIKASEMSPRDAMEELDIAMAASELE